MIKIQDQLGSLKAYIKEQNTLNEKVSAVSVGWHIEHSLLVIIKIIETVVKSNPSGYTSTFNFKKFIIFTIGRFPRGKADAPASVMPENDEEKVNFESIFEEAINALKLLEASMPNQFFVHPIFGKLNKKGTATMLSLHTNHHLLIIKDILKNK